MNEESAFLDFTRRLETFIESTARGDGRGHHRFDETVFNRLALELFGLQHASVPAYRRICEARGVESARVRHWSEIPAVPSSAFKELDLTSLAPERRTHVFESSGTTGQQPSRHYHDPSSLAVYEASLATWFRKHYFPDATSRAAQRFEFLALTPSPRDAPDSSLAHMCGALIADLRNVPAAYAGRVGTGKSWHLDFELTRRALERARQARVPLFLFGTAFTFVHLMDRLVEQDLAFRLPHGSCALETGGYKGRSRSLPKPELYRLIEQRLDIPESHIVSEYGMSELSSQAYDTVLGGSPSARRVFRFPPWARPVVISPENGQPVNEDETGLLRICDLANIRSVLAVQTQDLARQRGEGFELLGRAPQAEPRGCSLRAA